MALPAREQRLSSPAPASQLSSRYSLPAGLATPLPGTPYRGASRRGGRLPRAAARRSRGGEVGTTVAILRKHARLLGLRTRSVPVVDG
jgi:hypothetical protein